MSDNSPVPHRPPPPPITRTTRHGADQYVLACAARRDADAIEWAGIQERETTNLALGEELEWKKEHASTRTSKWVRGAQVMLVSTLVGISALCSWAFTANGRKVRVSMVDGYYRQQQPWNYDHVWETTHFLTSDMTPAQLAPLVERARAVARGSGL